MATTTHTARALVGTAYITGLFLGTGLVAAGMLVHCVLPGLDVIIRVFVAVACALGTAIACWAIIGSAYLRARLAEADDLERHCPDRRSEDYREGWHACARTARMQAY